MKNILLFGLITWEDPEILVIGTDREKVLSHTNQREIDGKKVALFSHNVNSEMTSFTSFEPPPEHFRQVKDYIKIMLHAGNIPVCERNVGHAKIVG